MRANIKKHGLHNAVVLSKGDLDIYEEGRKMIRAQAKQKGIPYSRAAKELDEIIANGMISREPSAYEFWQTLKVASKYDIPTAEEFVFYLSLKYAATKILNTQLK